MQRRNQPCHQLMLDDCRNPRGGNDDSAPARKFGHVFEMHGSIRGFTRHNINVRRSFIATIPERVMRLSPIPAASFPSVVPEHGQITTASIGAEPEADFAPILACSSRIASV